MEKFSEFITEAKEKPYNILVLMNDTEEDPNISGDKIIENSKKRGWGNYRVELDGGYITTDENGKKIAYNYDKLSKNPKKPLLKHPGAYDEKGFSLDPENTLIFVRGPMTTRDSWLDTLTQLERAGFCLINSRHCHEVCADKYFTTLTLAESELRQPKSVLITHAGGADKALELLDLEFPLILKTLVGTQGIGVLFIESQKNLNSSVQILYKLDENIGLMLQEYIPTKYDVRVHVLHDEVIATLKRPVIEGDFRSNISQGSKPTLIKLTDIEREDCIKAAMAVDGLWVGVDFIPAKDREKDRPYIIEVNSSPGTTDIDETNNINLVGIILEHYMDRSKWLRPKPFQSIYT